jgi:hypothetical protein
MPEQDFRVKNSLIGKTGFRTSQPTAWVVDNLLPPLTLDVPEVFKDDP